MLDTQFFQTEYINKDISVIPVTTRWDDKKQVFSGKFSAIKGWSDYCKELPDDDEVKAWSGVKNCTGMAFCCGEASNIACVDIDTEDPILASEIAKVLPYTPCRIIGHPKRFGKLLYRVTDAPATFSFETLTAKRQIKRGKEVVADLFMGNAYIVAPPSLHSRSANGKSETYYKWFDPKMSLEEVGIENLPVLPPDTYYRISQLIQGDTSNNIGLSLRDIGSEKESCGRFQLFKATSSGLIRRKAPLDQAVSEMLSLDKLKHPNNMYFKDKTKGFVTDYAEINAIKYYGDMLVNANKKGIPEIPRKSITVAPLYLDEWNEVQPIEQEKILLDHFDISLIPDKWGALVADVANSNGVPVEACFYLLLSSLSSLIGNKRVITAKKKNKSWEEAHNIWVIYVSPSGTRKTQVLKSLTGYLSQLQKEIDGEYQDYVVIHEKEKTIKDHQIKTMNNQLKKEVEAATLEHSGDIPPASKLEITRMQDKLEQMKEDGELIPKKQLVAKGATVEKLIEIIGVNKHGTFLEYNELTQLTSLFRKKGYESLRTLLLDSWDGLRPYSYQTKGSGEVFIEKNCTAMYGAIQNSVFERELREIALDINDDGFYQRSFIVCNDNPISMALDQEFDISNYKEAATPFREAYLMTESDEKVLTEHNAYTIFMTFEQKLLTMASKESISALGSFWGKFTGKVVKVAALLEFIKKGEKYKKISFESMNEAIQLMERQITHIKNMFPDPNFEHAREIVRLVNLGVIKDGMDHDKLVKTYPALKDSKVCHIVTEILYSKNYLDVKARDSKYYYYFNPSLKPDDTEQDTIK